MGKAGLLDRSMGDAIFCIALAHDKDLSVGNPYQPAREIRLPFDGYLRLYFHVTSGERLKIPLFSQRPVRPRGGHFEGIGAAYGVLGFEESADRLTYVGAVFHGDPFFMVDIVANQKPAPPPIDLDLDEG